jgi:uncharacterized protein with PIN domain
VKFVADGMLGSLTRWLRMLGQDIVYSVKLGDSQLLELAKREERALLTKDCELYKRAIAETWMPFILRANRSRSDFRKLPNGISLL